MSNRRPDPRALLSIALTLAIGAAGAVSFDVLGMPAAYLGGSMLAVGVAAVAGLPVSLPMRMRDISFVVIAAVMGSTVDQETIRSLPAWPVSLALLIVSLVALIAIVPAYLKRAHGYDRQTARLCAIPGALSLVIALATDLGADVRRVALVQTSRLAILMILIPMFVGFAEEISLPAVADADILPWPLVMAILVVCPFGVLLARKMRLPSPYFMGPFLLSGFLFGSGLTEGRMPNLLLWPALIVTGAAVGVQFRGIGLRFLADSMKAGLGATTLSIIVTGFFAIPVGHLLALPAIQIWLAFAPGGFEVMIILAFSFGLDPAFVAGHQLFRFLVLSLALPFLFRRPGPAR